MPLHKIKDFDPNYREHFDKDHDLLSYDLYAGSERVGSIDDILVDDNGYYRYLVVNTGVWILGKKVLLPVGRARVEYDERRIYVNGLTRTQVEQLPEYDANSIVDYDYEERVRDVYRDRPVSTATTPPVEASAPLETTPVSFDIAGAGSQRSNADYTQQNYTQENYGYDHDPDLYALNDRDHQSIKLYEERLIANKSRQKTGEVAVGKRVETETARVSVPIEKERIVIERVEASGTGVAVTPGADAFQEGEVARVEVYEENPDIRKEAFVREEVRVRKEVDRDTVEAQETLRREELDVDTSGNPVVQNPVHDRR